MNGFHSEWLPVSTVAEWLNVSPQTVRNWVKMGLFRARRINPNGMIYIRKSDVEQAIDEGEIG